MKIELTFFFFVHLDEYKISTDTINKKEYAFISTMPIQTFTVKIVIDFFGTEYSFAPITYVCFFFLKLLSFILFSSSFLIDGKL